MTRCQNDTPPRASASTVAHEKKGMAAAEMQDLATVGLPQTCRLAPEVLG